MKPLVLYINPSWRNLRRIHSPFLNPWWGNPYEDISVFSKQMFDTYSFDTSYYQITDKIEEADIVFAPYTYYSLLNREQGLFLKCIDVSRTHNLPLLIDGSGDIVHRVTLKNTFVLSYTGYRFLPEPNKITIPLMVDDLLVRCRNGENTLRKKKEGKPIIGFAGWTQLSKKQYLKTFIKELPLRFKGLFDSRYKACSRGVLWRQKAIKILQKSTIVDLNIRIRQSFSANQKTAEGNVKNLQEEMVSIILDSDYALDVRGDANNSARLFEILSLGRIPVIIDTERNFPFKDRIDYSSFALIVDFGDINKLAEIVADFHKNISPERFEEMQRNARNAFVNYFRIDAMMRYIVEDIKGVI